MFARLLKHELLTNIKKIIIICGLIIGSGIILGIGWKFNISLLFSIALLAMTIGIFAVEILVIVYVFQTIGRNTFDKRGYITFQIPVKTDEIIWSKVVSIIIFYAAIFISIIISLVITLLLFNVNIFDLGTVFKLIIEMLTIPGTITAIIYGLIESLASIMMLFFAFALCNIGFVKGQKIIMPILIYAGLSFVMGTFDILHLFDVYIYFGEGGVFGITTNLIDLIANAEVVPITFSVWTLLINIAGIIVFYFGTKFLMDKKLELQ